MHNTDSRHTTLLKELVRLEVELHQQETRRSKDRMETLLHPEFSEFGRSGCRYVRDDILGGSNAATVLPAVHAQDFELNVLAEDVALLTYLSAHVDADGNLHRHTLRSSVWVHTKAGWQMRFHQGTPTTPVTFGSK